MEEVQKCMETTKYNTKSAMKQGVFAAGTLKLKKFLQAPFHFVEARLREKSNGWVGQCQKKL